MVENVTLKTKESPRWEGQIIKWYRGNTFTYSVEIEMTDRDTDEPYEIRPEYELAICWYDRRDMLIHRFSFTNLIPYTKEDGKQYVSVDMDFDEEVSNKFCNGKYTYCIKFYAEYTTTIAAMNEAEVEICH